MRINFSDDARKVSLQKVKSCWCASTLDPDWNPTELFAPGLTPGLPPAPPITLRLLLPRLSLLHFYMGLTFTVPPVFPPVLHKDPQVCLDGEAGGDAVTTLIGPSLQPRD